MKNLTILKYRHKKDANHSVACDPEYPQYKQYNAMPSQGDGPIVWAIKSTNTKMLNEIVAKYKHLWDWHEFSIKEVTS
tara:strand:+ start:132 stop:365 length:234 start_codon:yes stop_codon:yes gene_type:complete